MSPKSPAEWREGTDRARTARENVAVQFSELLQQADMTGSMPQVARRIKEMVGADRSGDRLVLRAAAMEAMVALGQVVTQIDLDAGAR